MILGLIEDGIVAKSVAVVMQPVRTYCRGVLRGVATVSAQAGWECILVAADAPPPLSDLAKIAAGLIGHFSDPKLADQVTHVGIPAVDIAPQERRGALSRVSTDDVAVGRLAAAHLLSLGLPHFAFFGTRDHYYSLLRERGFKQTLRAAGLTCHVLLDGSRGSRAGHAAQGSTRDADDADDATDAALKDWLRSLPKPIGVLASTDSRALQILAGCRTLAIPVPTSVAVLGVDNDDVFCELANPPLSSIALSTQHIGYEAARLLDRLMAGERPPQRQILVPPAGVVPRRSSDLPAILDADVAAAVRYISLHVQDDLQVADLLREIPLSRRSLEQRFQKALGRTPAAEIRRAQIEVARQILTQTEEPMARVALASGFSNAKQLSASFRQETGVTPTAYRRRSQGR
jgi:LacI family transcriptional regulator